jgi:P4 family phage/plasmid primase-like protien
MPDHANKNNVQGTRSILGYITPELPPPVNTVAAYFANGVLDVERGAWLTHDRAVYNRGRLTVEYLTTAECPLFKRFVNDLFSGMDDAEERIALLQEIIGYMMIDSNLNAQKAIALDGVSRGGKGVIMEVLLALRGPDNYGVVEFSNMHEPKQQHVFINNPVVVDMDAKSPAVGRQEVTTGFFNKMVSGEHVSVPKLYKDEPFNGRLSSKMIVACNGVPQLIDYSGATTNRWIILRFDRTFLGREDIALARKLTTSEELTGIAAWGIEGLKRLIRNGARFTLGASSQESIQELSDMNQPFQEFVAEHIHIDPEGRCLAKDIYAEYRRWAVENGAWLPNKHLFGRQMKQLMTSKGAKHSRAVRVKNKTAPGYTGCSLVTQADLVFKGGE